MRAVFIFLFLFLLLPSETHAQSNDLKSLIPSKTTYLKAEVVSSDDPVVKDKRMSQKIKAEINDEEDNSKVVTLEQNFSLADSESRILNPGDDLVLSKELMLDGSIKYSIYDRYRIPPISIILFLFSILIILAAGKKGIGSIVGLGVSLAVIVFYIVPQIIKGANPVFVSISGSIFIMLVTIYLAHGFSKKTTIAVASTFISLILTGILALILINFLHLSGEGSEEAYMLQFNDLIINLKGLFLGGIIIGALGVLDDVTTTQTATIFTLAETNEKLTVTELIQKGLLIGREHITSLVNTLALAYAGASLPLFIFIIINPLSQPLWLILNNEMIVEEIVRTLAGSFGLILAVPITTVIASFMSRYSIKIR